MKIPKQFDEIRPYEPEEMRQAFEDLLNDRQFNVVIKGLVPWLPKSVRNGLLRLAFKGVKTPLDFQKRFMKPVVQFVIYKCTKGCFFDDEALTSGGGAHRSSGTRGANSARDARYTFVSNHRDIVLDSAFLDVLLIKCGYPTTVEIGIGDNLLIYPWIKRLVRMNKAFTVRRGLSMRETLQASQLMSQYIHYAVTRKKENIWIAQREGRAKDSSDRTQEAVLKMLAMGMSDRVDSLPGQLRDLNIVPLTISYEYDPCDYLKAQEMQLKRDNPQFKKSRQDDLDNMKTGILGYKGRVVYRAAAPVNTWIDELADLPKQEFFAEMSRRMDREIHRGYQLYPNNYIAADLLSGNRDNSDHYTIGEEHDFCDYLQCQLEKITIPDRDDAFLRECILTMYANPLKNYLSA